MLFASLVSGAGIGFAQEPPIPAISESQSDSDSVTADMTPSDPVGVIPIDSAEAPATTADAEAPEAPQLGLGIQEITVTAQKREESLDDVPIAISAFTGDTLTALGITDTRDLSALVPGFTAATSGYNTPVYTLRGIGFNDSTYTATSTVGVYVDEVSLPYSIMTKGSNLDLQRVEVLKGPQGLLYGRNTTGGAINYIANKPTDALELGVSGSFARFDTTNLDAFVSGPLSDNIRGRLAVRDVRSQEGWQYSLTRPEDRLGKQNKQAARGSLEWTPSDDWFIRFTVDGWSDRSDAQAPQAIKIKATNPLLGDAALHPSVRNHPTVPQDSDDVRVADWAPEVDWMLDDNYVGAALRANWNFSDWATATAIASFGDVHSDGSYIPQNGLSVLNADQVLFHTSEPLPWNCASRARTASHSTGSSVQT